ncbi:MAG: hypothetical protein LW865_11270 [Betaproteobacteria bacterium]|jgi:hypothetical protein|nr:hypothetical protein [Betaproteobacteria bacterium]
MKKTGSAFVLWSSVSGDHIPAMVDRFKQLDVAVVEAESGQVLSDLPNLGRPLVYLVPAEAAEYATELLQTPSRTARYGVALTPDDDIGHFMRTLPTGALVMVFVGPVTSPQLIDALGAIRSFEHAEHVAVVLFDHEGGRYAIQEGSKVAVRRATVGPMSVGAAAAEVLHRHLHLGFTIEEAISQPENLGQGARDDLVSYVQSAAKAPGTPFLLPSEVADYLSIIDLHELPLSRIWVKRADSSIDLSSPGLAHTMKAKVRAVDAPILNESGDVVILMPTDNLEGAVSAAGRVRSTLRDFLTEPEAAATEVDVQRVASSDLKNIGACL